MRDEGAADARKVIKKFHACLNSSYLVPDQCYQVNRPNFGLICSVNQIIALFMSKNYGPICHHLKVALFNLKQDRWHPNVDAYRKLATSYLAQVVYFLVNFTDIDPKRLPEELIDMGPQPEPDFDPQSGLFGTA